MAIVPIPVRRQLKKLRKWFTKAGSQQDDRSIRSVAPQSTPANIPTAEPKDDPIARSSPPPPTSPVASPAHASPTPTLPTTEEPRQDPPSGAIPSNTAGNAAGTQAKGPSCKCSAPPPGKKSRNLVVCIDGTANQFSMKNTNVVELYSRLDNDDGQLTYYNSGIGTFVKESRTSPAYWKQVISHGIDTAIAWNFKRIVLSAYQWLCENYEPGDHIFLYGE
ncbi:hypothetical protein FA95DRAFT_1612793 [Auriscalpium vulgare]|uniref:Uncharacterized protein n=1 Tax=Auriscalpium vulgare TaxID=40419 RepID=A0ACB8R6J1_9AGAM|nr:hypothetical protein FA95DRAFT_1612793 [Auriscalpium vulgare]